MEDQTYWVILANDIPHDVIYESKDRAAQAVDDRLCSWIKGFHFDTTTLGKFRSAAEIYGWPGVLCAYRVRVVK